MSDDGSICDVFIIDAFPYRGSDTAEYSLIRTTLKKLNKKPIVKRANSIEELFSPPI